MRKKALFALVALLCCWVVDVSASTLTENDALQIVKNNRIAEGLSNTDVNFYIAEVDTIVKNYNCPVEVNTITETWLQDNSSKWLVFVDEEPFKLWNHRCTYYYLSKNNIENSAKYTGCRPPEISSIRPIEMNAILDVSSLPTYHFPEHPHRSPRFNIETAADSIYVVLAADSFSGNGITKLFYNLTMVYCLLTDTYSIPKNHIRVVCGRGCDDNGYTMARSNEFFYLDHDIDGDGHDENIESYELYNQILAEELNPATHSDCRQLFIFTAKDGGGTITNNTLNIINSDYTSTADRALNIFYFSGGNNYIFNNLGYNTVITAPISNNEHLDDNIIYDSGNYYQFDNFDDYTPFITRWISALIGIDIITWETVNADYNNDGIISMDEASYYMGGVRCRSIPSNLAPQVSFASSPKFPKLIIKDNPEDVGVEPNTTSDITWNSPDIWVRNQNDGFAHQESEHLTDDNETKYIYVRIHNKGEYDYEGEGLKLYLATLPKPVITGMPIESVNYQTINPEPIECSIAVDSCAILEIQTNIYNSQEFEPYGGILKNDIIAAVDFKEPSFFAEDSATDLPNSKDKCNLAISKFSKIEPTRGTQRWSLGSNSPISQNIICNGITLPIEISGNSDTEPYSLEIRCSSNNQYQAFKVGIDMPQDVYDQWQNNGGVRSGFQPESGNPKCMVLSAANGCINDIFYGGGTINLKCFDIGRASLIERKYDFNLILKNSNGDVIDGQSFSLYTPSQNNEGPIIMFGNNEGQPQLNATNVTMPSTLEWFNESNDNVGEGEVLALDNNIYQEYTLVATDNETGCISTASIDMTSVNAISTVKTNGDNVIINLWKQANAATSVQITPLYQAGNAKEISVETGIQTVTIADVSSGMYAVSLIVNGEIVDSKRITK